MIEFNVLSCARRAVKPRAFPSRSASVEATPVVLQLAGRLHRERDLRAVHADFQGSIDDYALAKRRRKNEHICRTGLFGADRKVATRRWRGHERITHIPQIAAITTYPSLSREVTPQKSPGSKIRGDRIRRSSCAH
jgi:hypothetical protein